jgi:hypothetical protein
VIATACTLDTFATFSTFASRPHGSAETHANKQAS